MSLSSVVIKSQYAHTSVELIIMLLKESELDDFQGKSIG